MSASRSLQMARIRGKHTRPERELRSAAWAAGLRYRLHWKLPAGRPDLVFVSQLVAVFVDGCFWHGCPKHYVRPRTRQKFWDEKLATNTSRDMRQTRELEATGWTVLRFWEHEVDERLKRVLTTIEAAVRGEVARPRRHWVVTAVVTQDASPNQELRRLLEMTTGAMRLEIHRRHTRKWRRSRPQ